MCDKFSECKEIFAKYEKPNDQIMGTVFGKMSLIQFEMNNTITELIRNIELSVLKPLVDYQVNSTKNFLFISHVLLWYILLSINKIYI